MNSNPVLNALLVTGLYLFPNKVSEKSKYAILRGLPPITRDQPRLDLKIMERSKNMEKLDPVKQHISCVLRGMVFPRFLGRSIFFDPIAIRA